MSRLYPLIATAILFACGAESSQPTSQTATTDTAGSESVEALPPSVAGGELRRSDLAEILPAGPAWILTRVQVEPRFNDGQFVGYSVQGLSPDFCQSQCPIETGDLIQRINGTVLERPDDAFRIWTELWVASELAIELVRGDVRQTVRIPITEG